MLVNIFGCLFLICMSFYIHHVSEPSTKTDIISLSMFFVGLLLLVMIICSWGKIEESEKNNE